MVTWDDIDNENSSSSDDEQANLYPMGDIEEKVEIKTFFKSNTSSNASSDNEEEMPYDVFIHNFHMIFL